MAKMDVKRSYHGEWRIENEGVWLEGHLRLHRGGAIALELLGTIEEMSMVSQASPKIVHGRVGDLRIFISKLEILQMNTSQERKGVMTLTLKVGVVVMGREEDELTSFNYARVEMNSKLYRYWVDRRNVEWEYKGEIQSLSHDNQKFYQISLDDLKIDMSISSVFARRHRRLSGKVSKQSRIALNFKEPRSVLEILTIVERVTELIFFLSGYKSHPELMLYLDPDTGFPTEVLTWTGREKLALKYKYAEADITYDDVLDKFPLILENWIKDYQRLKSFAELQSSLLWREKVHTRDAFLSFIQMTEGLYDSSSDTIWMDKKDYEKAIRDVKIAIEGLDILEEVKSNMKDGIIASYKKNLSHKLNLLIDQELFESIGLSISREDFIKKVKSTRNYYTHLDIKYAARAFKDEELYHASRVVFDLIRFQLLSMIGVPKDLLVSKLKHRYRYKQIIEM
ncbi:hypothetical protein GO986_18640 [Deinococcus sp. HMF7620]|uniref:ApeA N-terminal domain-containing protein n=1 Tax=Deinococcus arboris TaxID=2682977 RepID=A0A7C9LX03_9DEIO|nr:HEPN domain-containing protein [Deinococcus arboris]MVN88760.1 hypothetical protein [Deinococcus arboris]